ncbi:MAG: IS110 family transposase [Rudaea sp.]|uniref:IS110 family transposase n=1 Tax=Rudaea sp. TaxID=2136325 RepID=UPI0039E44405
MNTQTYSCIGIDIGKTNFHVIGLGADGAVSVRSKHHRGGVVAALVKLDAQCFAMEACGGAHDLARRLRGLGREVRLLVPADVRAFVRTQKNDYNDAQAIAEAALRPTVRTVPIKSVEQQDVQLLHRARQRLVRQRTALINQIRAMLLEAGLTAGKGRKVLRRALPILLEDPGNDLSARRRALLASWREEWQSIEKTIAQLESELHNEARNDPRCARLMTIPGVGVLIATALVAAIGDASEFRHGRDLAAWLGLVPRQHSTGGRARLLSISKQGNTYLRWLFVHGARSAREHLDRSQHEWGPWLDELEQRLHPNKATVALANKLARIAWAVLRHGVVYREIDPRQKGLSSSASG